MAKYSDEEVGYSNSKELVLNITDRLPPPGGEDVPTLLLSKMQVNPGPVDNRKETMKSMGNYSRNVKDHEKFGDTGDNDMVTSEETICSVCCQSYVHPVELPCTHIFCYLCIKGVLARKPSCPFCRTAVPRDFVIKPKVVEPKDLEKAVSEKLDNKPQWYYEGRREGWWLYDPRTSEEIEDAYKNKKTKCIVQVAGFDYIIDFVNMVQFRQDRPERRRKILRSNMVDDTAKVKGVAGLYSKK